MKIRQMKIISETSRENLMNEFNASMRELADRNPEAQMADANTFYIFYDEWIISGLEDEEVEEVSNAIEIPEKLPLCRDCPHFEAASDRVLWGNCSKTRAACGGKGKAICPIRKKEIEEKGKEVEIGQEQQSDNQGCA